MGRHFLTDDEARLFREMAARMKSMPPGAASPGPIPRSAAGVGFWAVVVKAENYTAPSTRACHRYTISRAAKKQTDFGQVTSDAAADLLANWDRPVATTEVYAYDASEIGAGAMTGQALPVGAIAWCVPIPYGAAGAAPGGIEYWILRAASFVSYGKVATAPIVGAFTVDVHPCSSDGSGEDTSVTVTLSTGGTLSQGKLSTYGMDVGARVEFLYTSSTAGILITGLRPRFQ